MSSLPSVPAVPSAPSTSIPQQVEERKNSTVSQVASSTHDKLYQRAAARRFAKAQILAPAGIALGPRRTCTLNSAKLLDLLRNARGSFSLAKFFELFNIPPDMRLAPIWEWALVDRDTHKRWQENLQELEQMFPGKSEISLLDMAAYYIKFQKRQIKESSFVACIMACVRCCKGKDTIGVVLDHMIEEPRHRQTLGLFLAFAQNSVDTKKYAIPTISIAALKETFALLATFSKLLLSEPPGRNVSGASNSPSLPIPQAVTLNFCVKGAERMIALQKIHSKKVDVQQEAMSDAISDPAMKAIWQRAEIRAQLQKIQADNGESLITLKAAGKTYLTMDHAKLVCQELLQMAYTELEKTAPSISLNKDSKDQLFTSEHLSLLATQMREQESDSKELVPCVNVADLLGIFALVRAFQG